MDTTNGFHLLLEAALMLKEEQVDADFSNPSVALYEEIENCSVTENPSFMDIISSTPLHNRSIIKPKLESRKPNNMSLMVQITENILLRTPRSECSSSLLVRTADEEYIRTIRAKTTPTFQHLSRDVWNSTNFSTQSTTKQKQNASHFYDSFGSSSCGNRTGLRKHRVFRNDSVRTARSDRTLDDPSNRILKHRALRNSCERHFLKQRSNEKIRSTVMKTSHTSNRKTPVISNGHSSCASIIEEDQFQCCNHSSHSDSDGSEGDVDTGNAEMLNNFSIFEYFEPYHNETLIIEDDGTDAESDELDVDNFDKPIREPKDDNLTRKELRERGMEYTNCSGRKVPARTTKESCRCARLNCSSKYTKEIREKLLYNLLRLKSSGQNQFLSSHIHVKYAATHRVGVWKFCIHVV
ncbi:uncharacterized protein LOC131434017 [Malaya genurostris]|uniref:uncharacterized protein LOC131434017 n=1 Tax=Malaya genurostris TaxID=325434 RepID=UPI0026F3F2EC|nr:uncharacterized protein LOC131434017 [Malaya genurostris]